MTDFDDQLRRALERNRAIGGFRGSCDGTHESIEKAANRGELGGLGRRPGCSVVVSGALGLEMEHRAIAAAGPGSARAVIRAMQITSTKLHQIHRESAGTL